MWLDYTVISDTDKNFADCDFDFVSRSSSDQNELIAELVQQFLLPNAHKTAARARIAALQQAKLDAARKAIFGLLDDAEIKERKYCSS